MNNKRNLSDSESSSPNRSPTRCLPESHIIHDRYKSYHRAEDYIKHLNNIYNTNAVSSGVYDEAYIKSHKFRMQQSAENSIYKTSQFPIAKINKELLQQQEILNAFNQISFERPKSRPRPTSTLSKTYKRSITQRNSFSYKQVNLLLTDKCDNCHKCICQCSKDINDHFLKAIMKKHMKVIEKIKNNSGNKKMNTGLSIVDTKDIKISPERRNTYYDSYDRQISLNKAYKNTSFHNFHKKTFTNSPNSIMEYSLNISPLSINKRRRNKTEVQ